MRLLFIWFVITFDTEIFILLTLEGCHGWNKIGAGSGMKNFWKRFVLGSETISDNWKPFKNDEKCFLFHVKSSFLSSYIYIFILIFWLCRKNVWIRRLRFIPKLMMSRTGQQIIIMIKWPNISRDKDNHSMKFGQLI